MGRKIFQEKNFSLYRKVLPYDQFKPFINQEQGFTINEEHYPKIIEAAEKALSMDITQFNATDFMMFSRTGSRKESASKYGPRRVMLLALALGEYVERKGRFTDKLIDVIWHILEETTWVISAHNRQKPGVKCCLPYAFKEEIDYFELMSAATAATLAWVYYLCKDILDEVTTIISDRILYELNRRIIKPFMDDRIMWTMCNWSGMVSGVAGNWCPWIISNVLTVAALTVEDLTLRTLIIRRSLPLLDTFMSTYHPDGGCDEGPNYWNAAGGALYNACLVLYDMTGGYINIFDDPLMKNMGEYIVKVVITPGRTLNFADAPAQCNPDPTLIYNWGKSCNSEMMTSYAMWKLNGELIDPLPPHDGTWHILYRHMLFLTTPRLPKAEFIAPQKFYIGGLEIAGTREGNEFAKGLYLGFKGGHNGENHNHNDVGSIIVFSDDKPIFIDAGAGTYTSKTFSRNRYTIWAMCSDYHNCATFNGVTQQAGAQARSSDTVYDKETGKMTLNLATAYPAEANIESYTRSAELVNSVITVVDDVALKDDGNVMFSYIVRTVPENVTDSSFEIEGRTISFDPSLEYAIEELDKTAPEVSNIPELWNTDFLRRITLTSKQPVKAKKYVMTVK
ncbi:MAG: heparinase II/III family protein [Clostridia bacterium]|nr:heparinase II/III family protein [Clostridia bacterium]